MLLGAWILAVGAMYMFQRTLVYFPDNRSMHANDPFEVNASDIVKGVAVPAEDGLRLYHLFSPAMKRGFPVIIHFHGNHGPASNRLYKVRPYAEAGYGLLMVEYRGYGPNPGSPSEEGFYRDARGALNWLEQQSINPDRMVLYGESLGSGVAVRMAWDLAKAGTPVRGVVLEAPFTALPDIGALRYPWVPVQWLARDRFDNLSRIDEIGAPLLVMHGTADAVVPFAQGKALYEKARDPKNALFAEGAGHNNLYDFGAADAVLDFLEGLP